LSDKYKGDNCPIQPVRAGIGKNVMFISDSPAVKEVENLHHDESCKNEGKMPRMNFIFLKISNIIPLS
jgi:hypothetical protein